MIHIAEAPPHGRRFDTWGDTWPNGCPDGITLEEVGGLFYTKNIRYRLYKCR